MLFVPLRQVGIRNLRMLQCTVAMGMECTHVVLVERQIPHGQFRRRRFREAGDQHGVRAVLFGGVGDLPTYISGFATTRGPPDVGFACVRVELLCYECLSLGELINP